MESSLKKTRQTILTAWKQIRNIKAELSSNELGNQFRNIDAKHLCLVDVLKQSRVNDISFRLRLKDMITRFRGKPELFAGQSPADIQEKYVAVQGMLLKKESILVQWVPDGDFLNLDEVQKFFVKYGKAETTLD